MAVGKAKVKFVGGCLDGQVYDSFDTRGMKKNISHFNGYWYRFNEDKQFQLIKSDRIDDSWRNFSVDIYEKEPKGNDGYFTYRFKEKDTINRCTALTSKGTLCLHRAVSNTDYCPAHRKLNSETDDDN
jgi:hypothetical protein